MCVCVCEREREREREREGQRGGRRKEGRDGERDRGYICNKGIIISLLYVEVFLEELQDQVEAQRLPTKPTTNKNIALARNISVIIMHRFYKIIISNYNDIKMLNLNDGMIKNLKIIKCTCLIALHIIRINNYNEHTSLSFSLSSSAPAGGGGFSC